MAFTPTDLLIADLVLRKETPAAPVTADNLALVERGGLDGIKKKAVSTLEERADWTPADGRRWEGLKKGTYTVTGITADLLSGSEVWHPVEVEVRWYKRPNLHPVILIDGERVMSKDDPKRFRQACLAVQRGVAVKVS